MAQFRLKAPFQPTGDQPKAIETITQKFLAGDKAQVLLGVTGSGKTFTMANVIAKVNKPTLVIAPNKTLGAQLYNEFKEFFPENAVEYFVSYYDYYQPEAYVPTSDTFIEKDASINEDLDKLRLSATRSLLERNDVLIVASVSCIYGLGSPEAYHGMLVQAEVGTEIDRNAMLHKLVEIQYRRNDTDFHRGTFRVRGDVVEVFPAYEEDKALRISMFGDEIESIHEVDPLRGTVLNEVEKVAIYPTTHYVTPKDRLKEAVKRIKVELKERLVQLRSQNKLLEAQRIEQRTGFDLEMLEELGYCSGIENYSRHLDQREAGEPSPTLLSYFPKGSLFILDESHIGVPQLRAMYHGDRSRKQTLVEHGFRLPSAMDNRPLSFEEFQSQIDQMVYVSATPADFELEQMKSAGNKPVEQIIRPTGLLDPEIEVRPAKNQVDDVLEQIHTTVGDGFRVLITTLTKRMAEHLTDYLTEAGVRVRYLHSDIDTIERTEILRSLRKGDFDVLVGINLLREGLDLPEVALVAILDADKEGFLRSERSLIQTFGRAARNADGRVILYADSITGSMKAAMGETDRRRTIQELYNKKHGITPKTVIRKIQDSIVEMCERDYVDTPVTADEFTKNFKSMKDVTKAIKQLKSEMLIAARKLDFEKAAQLRDQMKELEDAFLS